MPHLADHAITFLLVLSRIGGLFVFAPMLASSSIPMKVRALVALSFAAAIYPLIPAPTTAPTLDLPALLPAVASETLIGVAIGLIAAVPMFSVQLAGLVMGQQMGLSLAGTYNPVVEADSDALGELLLYLAMGIFIASGGLDVLFLCIARSYHTVPMAGLASAAAPLDHLIAIASSGFELALRIAAPVTCIILLETLATGFISRTVPQLNILSLGFAIKILLGFTALIAALSAIHQVIGESILSTLRQLLDWSSTPGLLWPRSPALAG